MAAALEGEGGHDLLAVVPQSNDRVHTIKTSTYSFVAKNTRTDLGIAKSYVESAARGAAVAKVLLSLKVSGFKPDVVVGHGGWGETMFVRDVWPDCHILLHAEFFYSALGADIGFDPEFPPQQDSLLAMRVRAQNAAMALAVLDADRSITATKWQASRFPASLQGRITVAHEGIDTNAIQPSATAEVTLQRDDVVLRVGDEVVTFVSRSLEPYRGYHIFMRALPTILSKRPHAHVVIVGGEDVSYGPKPLTGNTWKRIFLEEVHTHIDLRRVHFVGRISKTALVKLLQVSAAHVYLTYPFVLSWSMLDAMSAGALVIGSKTPPVQEVIEHDANGLLCDFFDARGIADTIVAALAHPDHFRRLRRAARETVVTKYDLHRVCLPTWMELVRGR